MTLRASVESEAPRLAAELGSTAYEAGLLLRAPSPSVVLRTADRDRAAAVLGALRARGHEAVACDANSVVASEVMHVVRDFALEPEALVDGGERLAWSDVTALVRALHSSRVETTEKVTDKKLSIGRAALTGGVLSTRKVEKERTLVTQSREHVLYVFTSSRPWMVVASRAHYQALGAELRPSQHQNFERLVAVVRERCPAAPFDDRLLAAKNADPGACDLLANLVAIAVTRR